MASPEDPPKSHILFVANLANGVTQKDLNDTFKTFGNLHSVFINGSNKRAGTNYGFIQFEDMRDAFDAADGLNNTDLKGRPLRIQYRLGCNFESRGTGHNDNNSKMQEEVLKNNEDQRYKEKEKEKEAIKEKHATKEKETPRGRDTEKPVVKEKLARTTSRQDLGMEQEVRELKRRVESLEEKMTILERRTKFN